MGLSFHCQTPGPRHEASAIDKVGDHTKYEPARDGIDWVWIFRANDAQHMLQELVVFKNAE